DRSNLEPRQSSCTDDDRRRWMGWRSPRNCRLALLARISRCEPRVAWTLASGIVSRAEASLTIRGRGKSQFTVTLPQHFLYFFPDPHGHGSFRPTLRVMWSEDRAHLIQKQRLSHFVDSRRR